MSDRRRASDKWRVILALPFYSVIAFSGYLFYSGTAPVVVDFEVIHQQSTDDSLIISGVMNKVRDCKFESLHVTTESSGIMNRHNFKFSDVSDHPELISSTRLQGLQSYGPWVIEARPDERPVSIRSLHQCNFGLYKSTKLAVIE